MEIVQLVNDHRVEKLFHLFLVEKMAADIEHQAAPFKARLILDFDTGNLRIFCNG